MRTFVKKVELAIAAGNQTEARDALRAAESELMTAVSKGVIHKNTGSRKVSRLSSRVESDDSLVKNSSLAGQVKGVPAELLRARFFLFPRCGRTWPRRLSRKATTVVMQL